MKKYIKVLKPKFLTLYLLLFLFPSIPEAQHVRWNPDAGLVSPYKVTIKANSEENIGYIIDGNPETFWQSGNPLPEAWIKRMDLNLLLNEKNFETSPKGKYYQAFDGNMNTKAGVLHGYLEINFEKITEVKLFSLKAFCTDTLFIDCYGKNGIEKTFFYPPSSSYKTETFKCEGTTKTFVLRSNSAFDIFEIAALSRAPFEWIVFDLGSEKNIGRILSRHYNQSVKSIKVYSSNNGKNWNFLISLNPKTIPYIDIPLKKEIKARYLKIIFELPFREYSKAVLWEFNIYDKYGPYGKPFPAPPSKNTWNETFGINTIWGWGYSVYSDRLDKDAGPGMFKRITKQLRSYHRLDWDINNPATAINFDKMEKKGTPANSWLNWDREYGNWNKTGFSIDATLMFNNNTFPDTLWTNPYIQSYDYGKSFASHFVQNKHLVNLIEVGNEPWSYSPEVYKLVLKGMSKGIKSVSDVKVLPCAVQSYEKFNDDNNYISLYISENEAQYIDGLNTHIYPYVFDENGNRIAVNPEDRRSQIWSVNNLRRFVNNNMHGKEIYVTEFGYDSDGGNESCTHNECVSEFEQAIYGVRMAMVLWRLGAEKLYWYYFANVDYDSFMHNRSGLTASYRNNFRKKLSFYAFETLFEKIGDFRFEKVISENDEVYSYMLSNPANGKKAIIAWRPTKANHKTGKTVYVPEITGYKAVFDVFGKKIIPRYEGKKIFLSGIPLLIFL